MTVTGSREALKRARDAIATLPMWTLGGVEVERTDGSGGAYQYPIRDELLAEIDTALSADLAPVLTVEEIARVIEPLEWSYVDDRVARGWDRASAMWFGGSRVTDSLQTATAILSLLQSRSAQPGAPPLNKGDE